MFRVYKMKTHLLNVPVKSEPTIPNMTLAYASLDETVNICTKIMSVVSSSVLKFSVDALPGNKKTFGLDIGIRKSHHNLD